MKNEEIYTPTEIGLNNSDCLDSNHDWEIEYAVTQSISSNTPTKWRCKKCLCTRYTYD